MKLEPKEPKSLEFAPIALAPMVGSDPEIFLKTPAKIVPAFEVLPGKDNEKNHNVSGYNGWDRGWPRIKSYWDGFQAEFNCNGVAGHCIMAHACQIQIGLAETLMLAKEVRESVSFSNQSVIKLTKTTLENARDNHVALGCEPSLNAYDMHGEYVEDPRKLEFRFAGGHVHFGSEQFKKKPVEIVKSMDKILGIWAVGAAASFDHSIRRKYYGLAGEYRLPVHGIEYRVLSNFWLMHPMLMNCVYELGRVAGQLGYSTVGDVWVAPEEMVIEAINNCDVKMARTLLRLNKHLFKWLFARRGWNDLAITLLFDIGMKGLEFAVKDPEAINANWMLYRNGRISEGLAASYNGQKYTLQGAANLLWDGEKV